MAYISQETITGNGVLKTFSLANAYKAGTLLIEYNDKLFYEFKESTANDNDVVFDFAPLATDSVKISYYTSNEPNVLNATRYLTVRQISSLSRVSDLVSNDLQSLAAQSSSSPSCSHLPQIQSSLESPPLR